MTDVSSGAPSAGFVAARPGGPVGPVGPVGATVGAVLPIPGGSLGRALEDALAIMLTNPHPAGPPTVLDCGGGSGSLAVPIATRGMKVTVVDSSIDALAILERRAQEAGVSEWIAAVQADVENLAELVAEASVDLVLLHGVVTSVVEGEAVVKAAAAAVRPGGYLSVVIANPAANVLSRALGGDLAGALTELSAHDSAMDLPWLAGLSESFGLDVVLAQGLAAFSSTVSGSVVSAAHRATEVLAELDRLAATRFPYRDIAGRLHLLARRPSAAEGSPRNGT